MKNAIKKALAVTLAVTLVISAFVQTNFVYATTDADAGSADNLQQEQQVKEDADAKDENLNEEVNTNDELKVKKAPKARAAKAVVFEGEGTAANPYLIKSADDLKLLAEKVNAGETAYAKAVYKQSANIDLNGSSDNQWTPIGTAEAKFTGTFIGTGYEITGLYIDSGALMNAGLFGYIASPAKLEGITINGAKVNAKSNVGTIAGAAFTGSATNCTVKGKIEVSGNYKVGGMFGGGYISITDSKVVASAGSAVTGIFKVNNLEGDNVGGLIGFRGEGNIKTIGCSVSGMAVAGTRKVGGLIGSAYADNTVENCSVSNVSMTCNAPYDYAIIVKNQLCVGGLIGIFMNNKTAGTVKNCSISDVDFNIEDEQVRNENLPIMGIISGGYRANSLSGASAPDEHVTMTDIEISGNNSGSNAEEKFPGSEAMNGPQKLFEKGTGTAEDPFVIASTNQLKLFAESVNKTGKTYKDQYIKVAAAATKSAGVTFDLSGKEWTPIGTSTKRFMGTFDGNGATVKGLTTSFFGGVEDATIKNLKLADVNISDADQQGALLKGNTKDETTKLVSETCVGTITIDGIEVTGSISGSEKGDYIGSIMGGRATMEDGDVITIKNCINRATITGGAGAKIGGIIGYTNSSKGKWVIENCKNYGNITSEFWAGGMTAGTTRVTVKSCVNEGNIQGGEVTGGIIGTANGGTVVTGCLNKGDVTDTKKNAGGIIGSSSSGGNTVSQSANTGKITGVMAAAGIIGGTGSQGDNIDNCYNGGNIKATGENAIAAGIYGYNNSTSPVKACVNDAKVEAPNGTTYHIGLSNFWYAPAPGQQIATCYYIDEDGTIFAVSKDGKADPVEQPDMSRTELAEILNEAGGIENYWQAQNDSVQPDPIIPGALDEGRIAAIKDKDGNIIEGFASLQDAVKAAKDGQTIVLEEDVILEESLVIDGNRALTLDLNGKTLSMKENVKKAVLIVGDLDNGQDKTDLTLTDTALLKGGIKSVSTRATGIYVCKGANMTTKNVNITLKDIDPKPANIAIAVEGTLTVEEGTKIDSNEYGIGALANSKVVINGGEITATYAAAGGNGTWPDTEIIVNGGTLTSTESAGIYHPQSGKLTLNGGTIKGLTGVQMCAGELNIPADSTVKVIGTGNDQRSELIAADGPIMDGAAISIVNRNYPGGMPSVSIKGGHFVSENTDHAVLAYTWDAKAEGDKHSKWDEAGDHVAISGGLYNTPIEEELLADGFALNNPDKDGNYGVHKHNMIKFEKKDPTCTEDGHSKTYYKCDVCGKYFEDEMGDVEITDIDGLVIPAKGHNFVDGKCTVCGAAQPGFVPEGQGGDQDNTGNQGNTGNQNNTGNTGNQGNGSAQNNQGSGNVQTGDMVAPGILAVTLVAAGAAMAVLLRRRKVK